MPPPIRVMHEPPTLSETVNAVASKPPEVFEVPVATTHEPTVSADVSDATDFEYVVVVSTVTVTDELLEPAKLDATATVEPETAVTCPTVKPPKPPP